MKNLYFLILAACLIGGSLASNLLAQGDAAPMTKEALGNALLAAAREPVEDFSALVEKARTAGVNEALIAQASVFVALNQGQLSAAYELLPQLESTAAGSEFGGAHPFASRRQLDGFVSSLRALEAYQGGLNGEFETHAAKAFVDSPDFVEAFGLLRMMRELRQSEATAEAMAKVVVPMDLAVASADGESKPLGEWAAGSKAILLDFWASWCGPCIQLMPELKEKAQNLAGQGIFVAGFNTDESDALKLANQIRERHAMQDVPWLIEPDGGPLSQLLGVESIPRMLLITPEGKVLYNGHPSDPALKAALAKLDVTL